MPASKFKIQNSPSSASKGVYSYKGSYCIPSLFDEALFFPSRKLLPKCLKLIIFNRFDVTALVWCSCN